MHDDTAADSARLDRLAALLASSLPRTPAPELVRRVQTQAAAPIMVWAGGVFAVLGLLFVGLCGCLCGADRSRCGWSEWRPPRWR